MKETNKLISIDKFDEEYFDKCWKLANCFYQVYEYFYNKGVKFNNLPDVYKFCKTFWNNQKSFVRWNTEYCAWNWKYTDENGHEYNESEMLVLIKRFC